MTTPSISPFKGSLAWASSSTQVLVAVSLALKLSESGFSASTDLVASIIHAAGQRHHPRASAVRQIPHVASLSARSASVACRRTRPIVAISL
eukprot:688131-Pyramimonas_sp.AAC.1